MSQSNLLLFDANGLKYDYDTTKPNLGSTTFTKYQVVNGKWILYRSIDFNEAIAGGSSSDIVTADKPTGELSLPFSVKSIRRLQDSCDSSTVFAHSYYGGHEKVYTSAVPDMCADFPNSGQGASSLIIWPNKSWNLYNQKYYEGGEKNAKSGWYPTPSAVGFPNDSLKSMRPA
ncbi:uncharacterized protein LOC116306785 [Actinia tenebrosa]|uniref:Uncharacterized protein LOC116306785 n=1 Tax=Actinia tenebrosa TaxID=6105 RepID=A0A6P8J3Z4_ACTTE|nr:uncharacterized protein LOC116306785 [Actinia tenebrosa]